MSRSRTSTLIDARTLAVSQLVTQIAVIGTTVFLHRSVAHRAVVFTRPMWWVMRVSIWLTTGIKCREWAAVHRCHHAHTDEELDPHSPARHGFLKVLVFNRSMYRRAAEDKELIERYARDLPATAADKYLFDRSKLGLGLLLALLIRVLGPVKGVVAALLHGFAYIRISGLINAWGHHHGERPYDNSATNTRWLAAVSGGEGLHNNHHAMPTSPRFAGATSAVDPGWWVIRSLKALGQVETIRDPDALAAKAV